MSDDELEFFDYLKIVGDNWVAALLGFLVVFGLVLIFTMTTPPVYETSSMIMVSGGDQISSVLGKIAPKVDLETQTYLIMSPVIMSPVYTTQGVDGYKVNTEILKDSNVIEITVQAYDPEKAMAIANLIARSYVNYSSEEKVLEAQDVSNFITEQISFYEFELNEMTKAHLEFLNQSMNINSTTTIDDRIAHEALVREMSAKQKIYDYLLNRREEASIMAQEKSADVKIIGYAEYPVEPSKPNVPLYIAIGFILALGAGIGLAVFSQQIREQYSGKKKSKIW
ncbi:hypothetical protein JW711_05610 [Candidatus Woesearchaeota archaeon]|nr:hypothetical protein [Candidatus Woesearchaeota archaeon]